MEFNATFIAAFVSFILFTIIMNLILYKPINKIVDERQKFVDDNYEEAKQNSVKAEAIIKDKNKKIENTKHEAKKALVDSTHEAKLKKSELTSDAQKTASQKIDEAKSGLQNEKDAAQSELTDKVVDLAQQISSKILGESFEIKNIDKEHVQNIMQKG